MQSVENILVKGHRLLYCGNSEPCYLLFMQQTTKWYFALGQCAHEDFEIISYELFEAGVQTLEELDTELPEGGVMPDDPIALALTKGQEFGEAPAISHFRFFTDDLMMRDRIVELFPQLNWSIGEEAAQDWDRHWRERQQPVHVSPQLWVRPPWVDFQSENPQDVVLVLEAKSAFGTGEHESTALTAELMEAIPLQGTRILDIGTGTGILSMLAVKRGAREAIYTEIDPLAIPCLNENFAANDCTQNILGFLGGLECLQGQGIFDVVVCNMIRSEVWPLRADIQRLLCTGGHFILSGQLLVDKHYITKWFSECGFAIATEIIRGEWWSVCARKTN